MGDPPPTLCTDPEGRQVPCLGVCPFTTIKVQPPLPPGPPYKLPIQGAGPRRCEGWFLSLVVSVYGSFVAVSALARGRPAGGAQRAEETASLAIRIKTRASWGGLGGCQGFRMF